MKLIMASMYYLFAETLLRISKKLKQGVHGMILLLVVGLAASCSTYSPKQMDERIGKWYSYSTIDWAMLDTLYYRPYCGDWPDMYIPEEARNHNGEDLCKVWHLLQNARTKFHQDNLWLRAKGDEHVIQLLDETEAEFDSVFVDYATQTYYLRLFVDVYEEHIPQAIDRLCEGLVISENKSKK